MNAKFQLTVHLSCSLLQMYKVTREHDVTSEQGVHPLRLRTTYPLERRDIGRKRFSLPFRGVRPCSLEQDALQNKILRNDGTDKASPVQA